MIGTLIVLGLLAATIVCFWDTIEKWLKTSVADFIEEKFGYGARKKFIKAVVTVSKVRDKVLNHTVSYVKKGVLEGGGYKKITTEHEIAVEDIKDDEFLADLNRESQLIKVYDMQN